MINPLFVDNSDFLEPKNPLKSMTGESSCHKKLFKKKIYRAPCIFQVFVRYAVNHTNLTFGMLIFNSVSNYVVTNIIVKHVKFLQLEISLLINQNFIIMDSFIGQIMMFAGSFAPANWALCNGQILAISEHTALFSILGTTYGGDGRTTFALPDLRGRVPMGSGDGLGLSPRVIGQRYGSENVTLSVAQMPAHSHSAETTISGTSGAAKLNASGTEGTTNVPTGKYLAKPQNLGLKSVNMYGSSADIEMASDAIEIDVSGLSIATTVDQAGGNSAHDNIQPSLVMNYIICINGVYPSRN